MTFDPKKPVRLRNGGEARILCDDFVGDAPIVAALKRKDGEEYIASYKHDGRSMYVADPNYDLVNIPERVERWANVFPIQYGWSATNHKTKADADYTGDCRVGLVRMVFEGDKLIEVTLEKD